MTAIETVQTEEGLVETEPDVEELSGYRAGCELCENFGLHSGAHGHWAENTFYEDDY